MSSRKFLNSFVDNAAASRLFQRNGGRNTLVRRYIAGDQLSDALQTVKSLHSGGVLADICHVAKDLILDEEIERNVQHNIHSIIAVSTFFANTSISVTPSAIGMLKGVDLARRNLRRIVETAHERGDIQIRVAMEGVQYTQATIDMVREVRTIAPIVTAVIQSNLRRSDQDIAVLNAQKIPVRLVKGAYAETPMLAYTQKPDIDRQFRKQMFLLMEQGASPSIATHDPQLITDAKLFARRETITADRFEFNLWMGVAPKIQETLVSERYQVRVTIPYGDNWYPYFTERVAAHSGNLPLVLKGLLGG